MCSSQGHHEIFLHLIGGKTVQIPSSMLIRPYRKSSAKVNAEIVEYALLWVQQEQL